ncbi:ArsR/SmtB family transcription factor [Actinomadura sp. 3N407]|uniref:ArsR/SmtB family transcription factor n=1 Tax=Actinomadura sp. 3N407 TaxID=3457423 RepID=UPI003FCD547E
MNDANVLQISDTVDEDSCYEHEQLFPMDRSDAERIARVLKAVSDPTRLQLLSMIQRSSGGEACVCDLTKPLNLTQPTVSHHLKVLADAGLITRDKRGSWAWFAIVPERLEPIRALLG